MKMNEALPNSEEGELIENFGIGEAVNYLMAGKEVSRFGWNGNHRLVLITGDDWAMHREEYNKRGLVGVSHLSFIAIVTSKKQFVPWVASQTDLLSDDWFVV